MKNLVRNHKFLVSFAVLSILAVGCSSKQPGNEKSTNNNKSSEIITSKDKVEKDTSSKINSGLLLGLSKDNQLDLNVNPMERKPNDYRTLWIYEDNKQITYKEKENEIIAPYKDSFYKIGNNKFIMSDPISHSENQPDDIFGNYSSYYNFSNIVSHRADKSMSDLFTPDTFKKKYLNAQEGSIGEAYKLQTQRLYYVGNNYASIMTNYYDTGGGTYNSSYDDFKIYEIGNLSDLDGLDNPEPLFNLLDKSEQLKLKGYSQKYDKNISLDGYIKVDQVIDSENLQLFRSEGKWQVSIPLFRVYRHNGNGSNGKTVKEYINTDIKLPTKITSYDSLCIEWDEIKQKIPQAKDAVSSPNDDMLAVLTPSKLLVFTNPKLGIDKPSLSIDVDENESIILNQWATGEYVDKWTKLISDY
ncbi:MAG: hypothetical protein N2B06_08940 [Clostridium sp.]